MRVSKLVFEPEQIGKFGLNTAPEQGAQSKLPLFPVVYRCGTGDLQKG